MGHSERTYIQEAMQFDSRPIVLEDFFLMLKGVTIEEWYKRTYIMIMYGRGRVQGKGKLTDP